MHNNSIRTIITNVVVLLGPKSFRHLFPGKAVMVVIVTTVVMMMMMMIVMIMMMMVIIRKRVSVVRRMRVKRETWVGGRNVHLSISASHSGFDREKENRDAWATTYVLHINSIQP